MDYWYETCKLVLCMLAGDLYEWFSNTLNQRRTT